MATPEDIEETESISAYDAAKASGEEGIPLEQALQEIEESRRREALRAGIEQARGELSRGEVRRGTVDDLMVEVDK